MDKEDMYKNTTTGEFECSTTGARKKFTYDEFMNETSTWNVASNLNMKDLMTGKVSKVIKPVYRGDEVVWLVRWAVNVVKAEGVERPAVSEQELAETIRDRRCRIVSVSTHQFQIVMDA